MNKALLAVPVVLAALVLITAFAMRKGLGAPAKGTIPAGPTAAPPEAPVTPSTSPTPASADPATAEGVAAANSIRTETGAAVNTMRAIRRQIDVFTRGVGRGKAASERLIAFHNDMTGLRLPTVAQALPSAVSRYASASGATRQGAGGIEAALTAAQRGLTDLQQQVQEVLTLVATLRQKPEYDVDNDLATLEADLTGFRAAVGTAMDVVAAEMGKLQGLK